MSCAQLARWQSGREKLIDFDCSSKYSTIQINFCQHFLKVLISKTSWLRLETYICCTTKPATLSTSSNCTHTQCKINMGTAKIVQRIRKVGKTTNLLGPRFGRKVASSYIVQSLGGQDEMFPHGEICTSTGSYCLKRIIGEHLPPQWQQMIIVNILCRCKHGEHHGRRPKAKCLH